MKNLVTTMIVVMVMVMVASCQKDNEWMKNLTESEVTPSVVTDTVVNLDTVYIPQIDTVEIDTSTPGQTRIIRHLHMIYGQWSVSGHTATLTATHKFETIIIPDGGSAYVGDSVVFSELGMMTWNFPTYTSSVDGSYVADENGCPALGATCTFSWTYNVPEAYASYFDGVCEMWPTQIVVSGTTATVVTKHGNTSRTATYTITVNVPGPTIDHYTAVLRHNNYGQWSGTGATRTITANHWLVELAHWTDGTVTRQDSVLINEHGTMTWSFPTYTSSVDGTYSATASGCTAMNATCNVNWTYDPFVINGRTYTFNGDCSLQPTQVVVNGTTATVTTAHGNVTRDANYTLTINIPTPADTVDIFNGQIKYAAKHYSAVDYFCPASGDGWYWLVITEDNQWYTSPDATTAAGLNFTSRGTLSASDYAHIIAVSNFTAPSKSGNRKCAAWCRNTSAGATANVISTVEYDPNGGNPQLKYRNMSGSLIGACSAATGTIATQSVPEPVAQGGIKTGTGVFTFTLGGDVVK